MADGNTSNIIEIYDSATSSWIPYPVLRGRSAYESYLSSTTDNPPLSEADWVTSLISNKGDPGVVEYKEGDIIPEGTKVRIVEDATPLLISTDNIADETITIDKLSQDLIYRLNAIDEQYYLPESVLKDILKIKMRQSGLNLDSNAWSDTLEDINGVNIALSSSYLFISGTKSIIPNLNVIFSEDFSTDMSKWDLNIGGTITGSIVGGVYNVTDCVPHTWTNFYHTSKDIIPSTEDFDMEFDISSSTSGTQLGSISAGLINAADNSLCFYYEHSDAYAGTSGLQAVSSTGYVDNSTPGSRSDHVKFTVRGTTLSFYLNGTLRTTTTIARVDTKVVIGAKAYSGYSYITYGRIDNINIASTITKSDNAYVVWNPVQSDNILTRAIVEMVSRGDVTCYISRDGGTTFTVCTPDTYTDISSQPDGTSVVLKVKLNGDSELYAISWGGE